MKYAKGKIKMNTTLQQHPKLLLTRLEAAQVLGICERTLDTYTKDGTIPFLRIGSRVLYSVQALEQWIAEKS
jgi:excisionase family DNA binding protein